MNDERRNFPVDITTLDRVGLIEELHKAEARLRITRCDLARATGAERERLRERTSRMKTAGQRIRLELTRRNAEVADDFVRVARRKLDPRTFEQIAHEATAV